MTLNIIHLQDRPDRLKLLNQEIDNQSINDYRVWNGIRNDNAPWTGISQAHKQIVRHAQKAGLPQILTGEDDIKFTSPGAFDYFLKNIPENFDLYLGGIIYGELSADNTVGDFSGTMLYLLHHRFYEVFLSLPEDRHLDRALAGKGRFVVCHPMVAVQHNGYSDNLKRMADYEPYLKNYILFSKEA